jgi:Stage II sporulation protein E (SpoIIE).
VRQSGRRIFSGPRLLRLVEDTTELSATTVAERIGQALREWKGDDQHRDDITVLVLEREP